MACALGLSVTAASEVIAADAAPDLILHGGRIVTVDDAFAVREAVAIRDGKIFATGTDDEMLRLRGDRTEVVALKGGFVMPGLIDSHAHPADACLTEFDHAIPTMETLRDVLDYVTSRSRVAPEGEWIVVRQVFITRLVEQRYPTRAELDQAAPRHPVMFATGPDASLNSLALQRSGIGRDFKVTDGGSGFAERDAATGEPTGILRNCTRFVKVETHQREPTNEEKADRLVELFRDYNSVGITGVCERDASVEEIERYRELRRANRLTLRVSLSKHVESIGSLESVLETIRDASRDPLFKDRDEFLRLIGVKTYLDGGMLTGSAFMRRPWGVSDIYAIRDPEYRGVRFILPERLVPMVRAAVETGLQFTAHAVGDGAVHALLEAYDAVNRELPIRGTRPCISHSNFMSREAVDQAARLGVAVDIQPAWLYLDTRTLVRQFGLERLRYFQPLRSLFEAGVVAGGGSDHMQKIGALRSINPYHPFLGMATAVTRRAKGVPEALHPEEALSREQAIRFYTIQNARLLRCDDRVGSLEPGKWADLVILDTDLLTCPDADIAKTKVLRTYLGGRVVWPKP